MNNVLGMHILRLDKCLHWRPSPWLGKVRAVGIMPWTTEMAANAVTDIQLQLRFEPHS